METWLNWSILSHDLNLASDVIVVNNIDDSAEASLFK